jgi:hypothetical protein
LADLITINISTRNHEKLMTICEQLEQILRKKHVSADEALSVVLSVKHVEEAVTDMALASEPTWRRTKKEAKEE